MKGHDLIYNANELATGGYISGEVKVSITIRLLSGGDTLDFAVIFGVYPTHVLAIFHEVITYWIKKQILARWI